MKDIKKDYLNQSIDQYLKDQMAKLARQAVADNEIFKTCAVVEQRQHVQNAFSIDIKTMGATSQNQSGRCWIFAGLNVLREEVAKKCNIKEFELSQNYTAFFDKLEKINYFLETVIELKDADFDDRTLTWVLQNGIQDGGQWDMLTAVIKKYGVVPKSVMPETYQSSHTRDMNKLLNRRLRRFAYEVKTCEDIDALKKEVVDECIGLLCTCFGVPPQKFDFEYVDQDNNYHCVKDLDPMKFYDEYVGLNLDDYVSLIHSPTIDKPYHKRFSVKYLGNVVGVDVSYLNLPMDEFKEAVIKQLQKNEVVWFGSDCGNFSNKEVGCWDDACFDADGLFNVDFGISKEASLYTRDSAMNHAMVLTGVNLDGDQATKWKIENSWGNQMAHQGYFVASDSWFDRYVYQAVVHKSVLTAAQLECLNSETNWLQPWDPMGTLAK